MIAAQKAIVQKVLVVMGHLIRQNATMAYQPVSSRNKYSQTLTDVAIRFRDEYTILGMDG